MTISKHINWEYDAASPSGVPNGTGDRYYAQDLIRDLIYLIDRLGLTYVDIKGSIPFIVSGGLVTQGAGTTLNITEGVGYAKYNVQTVNSFASTPPSTQDEDIEAIRVEWTAQTNLDITGYTPGGATNYVKIRYNDLDGSSRSKAKSAGSWNYDQSPSFSFIVNTTTPTNYDILLDTFTESGGTFTFTGVKSPGIQNVEYSTLTMKSNGEYIVNYSSRVNLKLPTTASYGSRIKITDLGSGGWKVTQNSGQNILWMNKSTIPGTTGYIESKTGYASIELFCIVKDTTWIAYNLRDIVQMKGYILGGNTSAATPTAVIEDLIFSVESSKSISATLDSSTYAGSPASSHLKGYIMGGWDGVATRYTSIEDLIFSNETSQAIVATLDTAKSYGAGAQSSSKGYIMGGATPGSTTVIEDLIFSNETSQAITATLPTSTDFATGVSSNLKGYCMGGGSTKIQDLIFSTEITSTLTATLSASKSLGAGVYGNLKGYLMGGILSTTSVIEDMNFSNDTSQAIVATLDTAKGRIPGVSSNLKGYCMGGDTNPPSSPYNIIEDLEFLTESSRAITATLDTAKSDSTGVQGYN